jgi:magnesium transporter
MIEVVHFLPDGRLRCGGRELLEAAAPEGTQAWIDVEGQSEENERLIAGMGFHPLAVEDTFTLHHQPKYEEYEDCLFLIVRGIDFNTADDRLDTLKLAAFLGTERLVTFHRAPLRSIATVRQRLRDGGRVPRGGLTHLLYLIYDELISLYLPVIEEMAAEIESIEDGVLAGPDPGDLEALQRLRRQLATFRKVMVPHRQVFNHLASGTAVHVSEDAARYFRDIHDEVFRLTETVDIQREQLAAARETYLTLIGQRTNEVMKVLTIISAVLLPLSVIAGIYGMNFEHMPELGRPWGYPVVLAAMAVVGLGMLGWFKRKGWL